MIDLNDPQLDDHGKHVHLLTNTTFKHQIEEDCIPSDGNSRLKDAKYIKGFFFTLNITELYDNDKSIED